MYLFIYMYVNSVSIEGDLLKVRWYQLNKLDDDLPDISSQPKIWIILCSFTIHFIYKVENKIERNLLFYKLFWIPTLWKKNCLKYLSSKPFKLVWPHHISWIMICNWAQCMPRQVSVIYRGCKKITWTAFIAWQSRRKRS